MLDSIKPHFFEFIKPIKSQLDRIDFSQASIQGELIDSLSIPIAEE